MNEAFVIIRKQSLSNNGIHLLFSNSYLLVNLYVRLTGEYLTESSSYLVYNLSSKNLQT